MSTSSTPPRYFERNFPALADNRLGRHAVLLATFSFGSLILSAIVLPSLVWGDDIFTAMGLSPSLHAIFYLAVFLLPIYFMMGELLCELSTRKESNRIHRFLFTVARRSQPTFFFMGVFSILTLLADPLSGLVVAGLFIVWLAIKAIPAAIGYGLLICGKS